MRYKTNSSNGRILSYLLFIKFVPIPNHGGPAAEKRTYGRNCDGDLPDFPDAHLDSVIEADFLREAFHRLLAMLFKFCVSGIYDIPGFTCT